MHKAIMVAALMLSVAALPFPVKICHAAIIIVIITWLFEGQWGNKLSIIKHSLLLHVIMGLFFLQVLGLAFSDNLPMGLFTLEKKIFFLLIPVKEVVFYSLLSALLFFQLNSFKRFPSTLDL